MNEYNEAGQSAWEHCSIEELAELGLLSEADLDELFAPMEAEAMPMAA